MRALAALTLSALLVGCSVTRPDQDNFEIDASKGSIESFVSAVSQNLDASVSRSRLDIPDSDPGIMYEISGHGVSVIIQSQGDDRCIPQGVRHTTYDQRRYYVDLVYRTSSASKRAQAKQQLVAAAKTTALPIQVFKEC
jgi:hypothetical protein